MPIIGAALILAVQASIGREIKDSDTQARHDRAGFIVGLMFSIVTFGFSLLLLLPQAQNAGGFQFVEKAEWFSGVFYSLGVDGFSIALIILTTFLTPIALFGSMGKIKSRATAFVVVFLMLESLMIAVFCSLDLVLFYIVFELGLIPMFLMIGIWGGKDRLYASFKFFLYTAFGSLFLLAAIVAIYLKVGSTDLVSVLAYANTTGFGALEIWLFLAFALSFGIKLPMWPVHTWLPDAHVQAPTAGSVILAGILLKMGGYGFLRFALPLFPAASLSAQPYIFALSVIAIIYTSLVALKQTDMKKLIAYSSVAHMGFVTLGIFSFTQVGVQGAIFQMLSHGLISGALFLLVGVVYERTGRRDLAFYGGLVHRMPIYAAIFMVFTMANVGLPGTSGFVGEILTMTGAFLVAPWAAVGAATGVIFSAVYMLHLYRETIFGKLENEALFDIKDVSAQELICLMPLLVGTIVLGIYPSLIFDLTDTFSAYIVSLIGELA